MLTEKYNHKESEKKWQNYWREKKIFQWKNDLPREQTFVIDTPPPTVSGLLHMGHVFSYTQADFVARFKRMSGHDVFYPMGFDDNGLPTERLVEKVKGVRASQMAREEFVAQCREVVDEAEKEFEALFNAIALSVDWEQKYQTISPESQFLSQSSFVDLYKKGLIYRDLRPVIWDCVDQTALSQADLVDVEKDSFENYIEFESEDGEKIKIMTTRPELLPACVALMIHPEHEFCKKHGVKADFEGFINKRAYSTLFNVAVPIIADLDVKIDKGTGAVMCCTYGDDTDVKWVKKHGLKERVIIADYDGFSWNKFYAIYDVRDLASDQFQNKLTTDYLKITKQIYLKEGEKSVKIADARKNIIETLKNKSLLLEQKPIKHSIKCAERSGAPIEFVPKHQWFIKLLPHKNALLEQIEKCTWNPDYMKVRATQWCENLASDWCISRQRFFGVPIPAFIVKNAVSIGSQVVSSEEPVIDDIIVADFNDLPLDPCNFDDEKNRAKIIALIERNGYKINEDFPTSSTVLVGDKSYNKNNFSATKNGTSYLIAAATDVLDTWATSSISPQLSSKVVSEQMLESLVESGQITAAESAKKQAHHQKLFPADMRPQAHEIIRTWAFYTIAKALLHEDKIPWKNLMISGWCLAADKTKMSKSKGNVVTPTSLVEEKSSDVVRYFASTSHLGADTAYSEEVFKIGHKLVTKLFNAAKFVAVNFEALDEKTRGNLSLNPANLTAQKIIFEAADLWILSKLQETINYATASFEKYEYARAREKIEEFFWHYFCDNYLEIVKVRSYGLKAEKLAGTELDEAAQQKVVASQLSAIHTLRCCLNALLKLFAPFIPHITEEIYAGIFAQEFAATRSINARGNWPKIAEQFFAKDFCEIGDAALEIIFAVRKFKSDNNLSMKTTIARLKIAHPKDLTSILADLANVCNAAQVEFEVGEMVVEIDS